jgi:hypothetical protein
VRKYLNKQQWQFGLIFDWDEVLEEVPHNFFTAKVFFKDKKHLIGF